MKNKTGIIGLLLSLAPLAGMLLEKFGIPICSGQSGFDLTTALTAGLGGIGLGLLSQADPLKKKK